MVEEQQLHRCRRGRRQLHGPAEAEAVIADFPIYGRGQGPRRRRFPGAFFRLQQGGRRNSSRFFARNSVPQKVVFRNNPHTLHQYRNCIISHPQQFLFFLQQILVICAKYPIQALEYFHKSCVSTHFFLTTCTRKWYKGSRIASLEICPSYGTVVMRKRLDTI